MQQIADWLPKLGLGQHIQRFVVPTNQDRQRLPVAVHTLRHCYGEAWEGRLAGSRAWRAATAERTVGLAGMIAESLTTMPGIREQPRPSRTSQIVGLTRAPQYLIDEAPRAPLSGDFTFLVQSVLERLA
jgi:hypothetical protein